MPWVKISHNRYRWIKSDEELERLMRPKENFHHVQDDTMEPTWHPATGEMIDSKSRFRQVTKNAGCIELGNENMSPKMEQPKEDTHAIGKMIWDQMEAEHIDYRDLRRDIHETFEYARKHGR